MTAPANACALEQEIDWFGRLVDRRFRLYFEEPDAPDDLRAIAPPDLDGVDAEYAQLVAEHGLDFDERLVLVLALLPQIRPQALDVFLIRNSALDGAYVEFGGRRDGPHGGFLPTLETAAFVLSGTDLQRRFDVMRLFDGDQPLASAGVLDIDRSGGRRTLLGATLAVSPGTLSRLTHGVTHQPDYSAEFPAKRITTPLGWDDLILAPEVLAEIDDINAWLVHSRTLLEHWGLQRMLKPGFRSLFHGPPGTGKTLTATLIGTSVDADVYRIDLSMVVSKYIGETEKNLANVFDQAEKRHWILFFDEADSLFAKRTQTTSANDRSANREVSYLLQRVEDYPGVVILATNLQANIDEAFARRFQSVVYFPVPDAGLRWRLWRGIVGERCHLAADIDLEQIAQRHELSGGAIINVVRYAAIQAVRLGLSELRRVDLLEGIKRELGKSGRTLR